ncbi:hypothetical protein ACUWCL_28940, partial [Klebsiella pneumoniae]|uniref:hypothetical protein n=1 Tax=Klebsiella pneumoniae TaxID=573 RepID=UPI0040557BF2
RLVRKSGLPGATKNYINPNIISSDMQTNNSCFVIKTPTGRAEGTQSVNLNLLPLIGINYTATFLVYPFSTRFDILLGYETMRNLGLNIDCNNKRITIGNKEFN